MHCDAKMNQKAFSSKSDGISTEQQAHRWRRNEAGRRRKYGRQTQERSGTFQLKSRDLKSSRGFQSEGAGSSHAGSQRNCTSRGNKTGENGDQSCAVRDILIHSKKLEATCILI